MVTEDFGTFVQDIPVGKETIAVYKKGNMFNFVVNNKVEHSCHVDDIEEVFKTFLEVLTKA